VELFLVVFKVTFSFALRGRAPTHLAIPAGQFVVVVVPVEADRSNLANSGKQMREAEERGLRGAGLALVDPLGGDSGGDDGRRHPVSTAGNHARDLHALLRLRPVRLLLNERVPGHGESSLYGSSIHRIFGKRFSQLECNLARLERRNGRHFPRRIFPFKDDAWLEIKSGHPGEGSQAQMVEDRLPVFVFDENPSAEEAVLGTAGQHARAAGMHAAE